MSKKVFIGVGHGGSDSGAVGDIIEKQTSRWRWRAVII